jgi:hypothetical protein
MSQIYVNGFLLEVISVNPISKKNISGANYYLLRHGSIYKLKLSNQRSSKCDAEVWIDGEKIGIWRIEARSQIIVERPAKINRKFVFLKEKSMDAQSAGIGNSADNGLIKVIFKPEKYEDHFDWYNGISSRPFNDYNGITSQNYVDQAQINRQSLSYDAVPTEQYGSYSHGATVLGQKSNQEFLTVQPIPNIDNANITTIMARLLVDNENKLPFVSLRSAMHTTTYPKRLDSTILC